MVEINWIPIILSAAVAVTAIALVYKRLYRPFKKVNETYLLYKVRDAILMQLVLGKISEDSAFIRTLYEHVNTAIKFRDEITIRKIVAATKRNGKRKSVYEELIKETKSGPKELTYILDEYVRACQEIIISNSVLLRLIVTLDKFIPTKLLTIIFLRVSLFLLDKLIKVAMSTSLEYKKDKYEAYVELDEMDNRLTLAHASN